MTACANHASAPSTVACADCAAPYCGDCTVEFLGKVRCGACKLRAARLTADAREYALPTEALRIAVIGIFCFGILLEPVALVKSIQALREIGRNPTLPGRGKAIAALVVATIVLLLNLVYIALLFAGSVT